MTNVNIAQPDVTLHLDAKGIITSAAFANSISDDNDADWQGLNWADTIVDQESNKIHRMLEDARSHGVSSFRQVNQRFPSGLELPIEYTTVRLAKRAGFVAIGKNLQAMADLQSRLIAAQQAMERDYWKLRDVETRYRHLFDASSEAVLVIAASDLSIAEANPAAIRALGIAPVGSELLPELQEQQRQQFMDMLALVREPGKAPGMLVNLGQDGRAWLVRASLMTFESGPAFLLQLSSTVAPPEVAIDSSPALVEPLILRSPDGFVVSDREGSVKLANQAFLDLVQVGAEGAVVNQPLSRWLGHPGADAHVLLDSVRRHGSARLFATILAGELGIDTQVEISAVGDRMDDPLYFGIGFRDVSQRLPRGEPATNLDQVLEPFATQIGATPLKELVRKTVGAVEQHYVEAALGLTSGNRTAAAELLGLSRQSLYAKLNRYGMGSGRKSAAEPDD